jgi:glycine/D-amino acid oxidase-like deaminating enzyme
MPLDRGTIEQQLHALGESPRWWDRRELRDLPGALHADETIRAIAVGKLFRPRLLRRAWLIVVTDARLLCICSGSRMSRRQIELHAGEITRVWSGMGVFRSRVVVLAGGVRYRLIVRRTDAFKLLAAISNLIQARPEQLKGSWPTAVAGRVVRHILALPTVALQPEPEKKPEPLPAARIDQDRLALLEDQVQRLQQQVDFLENLLRRRYPALTGSQVDADE